MSDLLAENWLSNQFFGYFAKIIEQIEFKGIDLIDK